MTLWRWRRVPVWLGLWALLCPLAGCDTPCQTLRDHALGCGAAPARTIDPHETACVATRKAIGKTTFDTFADCVLHASCVDTGAIARCGATHVAGSADDACTRYRLWIAACGLQPFPSETGCPASADLTTVNEWTVPFADWVDCVTADGCPTPGDSRFDTCQNLVPQKQLEVIDACVALEAWTERCAPLTAESSSPVLVTPFEQCLVQAQAFAPSTFVDFAGCEVVAACDDTAARLNCWRKLGLTDPGDLRTQCDALIARAVQCNNPAMTVDVCLMTYGGFTPASVDAFIACLLGYPCDNLFAPLLCSSNLVPRKSSR
jgi:hypothetical protein